MYPNSRTSLHPHLTGYTNKPPTQNVQPTNLQIASGGATLSYPYGTLPQPSANSQPLTSYVNPSIPTVPQSTVYYENSSNTPLQRDEGYATNPPLLDQGSQYHRSSTGYPFDSYYPAQQVANDFSKNLKESNNSSATSKAQNLVQLNPGPEFIRATVGKVPHSASLKQKSHIPLGIVIRPLAPSNCVLPDVNFGRNGKVIRCVQCRTYLNIFSTYDTNNRRWTCNICGLLNELPSQYSFPIVPMGSQEGIQHNPELHHSSIEILASSDYMVRPPQPPSYLFLIDVTVSSLTSGMLSSVCEGIKGFLDNAKIKENSRTQIGFMTFDSSIHFYKILPQNLQPDLIVVPTLTDAFVPIPEGIMVNLKECEKQIYTLLDLLPSMWASQRNTESCMCTALRVAHIALKPWGGKLSIFFSTLSTLGENNLSRYRETQNRATNSKVPAADLDTALLKPLTDEYTDLAHLMAQAQICVELYSCPPASNNAYVPTLGLPTLGHLSRYTGGTLRYYPGFNAVTDGVKLKEEIIHSLTRNTGWEAVMRVRVSQGWKISSWAGHFYFRNNDLLVLPNCHEDQVFAITLEHQDTVHQDHYLHLQSALLYTNSEGERRIRVHSFCIPVTQSLPDLVASVDEEAIMVFLTHKAILQAMKTNLGDARTSLQTALVQMYSVLQQGYVGNAASTNTMQSLLPYYVLGLLKSVVLRDGRDVTVDARIYCWWRFLSLPIHELISFFSPRLYALHELDSNSYGLADASQQIELPPTLGLSSVHMSQDGAYLLCDGECLMLWIGKLIDAQWLENVFGVTTVDDIPQDNPEAVLGITQTEKALRVAAIIETLRRYLLPHMRLLLFKQGSPNEYKFFYSLIEDKNHACMISYDDFCTKLSIRNVSSLKPTNTGVLGYQNYHPLAHQQGTRAQTNSQEMPSQYNNNNMASDMPKPGMRLTQKTNASPYVGSTKVPEIPFAKGAYDTVESFSNNASLNDPRMDNQRLSSAPFMRNGVPQSMNASGGMNYKPSDAYVPSTMPPQPAPQDMRLVDRFSNAKGFYPGNKEEILRDSLQSTAPYAQPPYTKQTDQPSLSTSTNYYASNNAPPQIPYTR